MKKNRQIQYKQIYKWKKIGKKYKQIYKWKKTYK